MEWTTETVEGLAPDPASITAARKLARPAPWSETGRDERAVWGLCKGSGKTPYQVQVDTTGPAYTCSCPSRKVPCKHALALLLLAPAASVRGRRAAGVGRSERERARAAARAPGEPPRDPEAAARRAAEREERVAAGVEDLRLWLRDAVRGGLGAGRLRTWDEWDALRGADGRRAGAGRGLAAAVAGQRRRRAGRTAGRSGCCPAWVCCTCCARRTARADGPLRDDVRTLLGWNVAREDVLAGPHVRDRWTVLARVVLEQERLRVARTWLWGQRARAGRAAARLRPAGRAARAAPAGGRGGRRRRWPSTPAPRRCARWSPARRAGSTTRPGTFGTGGAEAALATAAAAIAANPWLDEWPVALAAAVPDGRRRGR